MIYETNVDNAIEITRGGDAYINPYDGCTSGCPFCYWLSRKGWEGNIGVRLNIAEVLDKECEAWTAVRNQNPNRMMYIGDYCDPYMAVEEQYGLTRKCIEVMKRHGIPLTICTSAKNRMIFRDLELLSSMKQVRVVTELCRLDQIENLNQGKKHMGIETANHLHRAGITVLATFAPIMPGITDIGRVLDGLDVGIPLYIDRFYMKHGTIQEVRFQEYLKENHQELIPYYEAVLKTGICPEYEVLRSEFEGTGRVFPLPF